MSRAPVIAVLLTTLSLLTACQKETAPVEEAAKSTPAAAVDVDRPVALKTDGLVVLATRASVPPALKSQLESLLDAYLALKDALVKGDSKLAGSLAGRVLQLAETSDASGLEGDALAAWLAQSRTVQTAARGIVDATDIKTQRDHLFALSEATYAMAWSFVHAKKPLFVQFCPMAHTDKGGAHWVSDKSEIRNPYYGDAMLECGEVRKVLR